MWSLVLDFLHSLQTNLFFDSFLVIYTLAIPATSLLTLILKVDIHATKPTGIIIMIETPSKLLDRAYLLSLLKLKSTFITVYFK